MNLKFCREVLEEVEALSLALPTSRESGASVEVSGREVANQKKLGDKIAPWKDILEEL